MLAASGTAATAQEDIDFKSANIDHVSIQVADLQRSVEFYQKMFGFSVISQDQPRGIIRLGTTKTLVSLNHQSPAGIVDHFAIGIPSFSKESAARYLTQRGASPEDDPFAGLHFWIPTGLTCKSFIRGDLPKRSSRYAVRVAAIWRACPRYASGTCPNRAVRPIAQ